MRDERLKLNIAEHIYDLRASTAKTQAVHNQLIEALIYNLQTGERTALKQWRQNMGAQEEARYINELEAALHQKF